MNRKNRKVKVEDSPFYTKEELKQIEKNINTKEKIEMLDKKCISKKPKKSKLWEVVYEGSVKEYEWKPRYLLVREIPKSLYDLHREHPWYTYGALMDREVELTKQQLEWILMLLEATKNCTIDCAELRELIKKVIK